MNLHIHIIKSSQGGQSAWMVWRKAIEDHLGHEAGQRQHKQVKSRTRYRRQDPGPRTEVACDFGENRNEENFAICESVAKVLLPDFPIKWHLHPTILTLSFHHPFVRILIPTAFFRSPPAWWSTSPGSGRFKTLAQ